MPYPLGHWVTTGSGSSLLRLTWFDHRSPTHWAMALCSLRLRTPSRAATPTPISLRLRHSQGSLSVETDGLGFFAAQCCLVGGVWPASQRVFCFVEQALHIGSLGSTGNLEKSPCCALFFLWNWRCPETFLLNALDFPGSFPPSTNIDLVTYYVLWTLGIVKGEQALPAQRTSNLPLSQHPSPSPPPPLD